MKINKQIQKEIEALANMPDSDIDYSDIDYSDIDYSDIDYSDIDYSDIDYSDIPEMDSQIKFTRVSNKQFNEFVNSEVV